MPRLAKALSALEVKRLNAPGLHPVGTVPGLCLQVSPPPSIARSWILRVVVGNRRRDLGLGGYPAVSLAHAIEAGRGKRQQISQGVDPVSERHVARRAIQTTQLKRLTFAQAAQSYITVHEPSWKNAKHISQWRSTLKLYVFPKIGGQDVGDVGISEVLSVLEPIWNNKTETASRIRGRLELVIAWADKRAGRERLNPARWRGHLDTQLPAPSRVAKTTHHPALPIAEIGGFVGSLRMQSGIAARALEFAILTAARSGEVRFSTWSDVDFDARVWTIPKERMKSSREHRVPLNASAIALLRNTQKIDGNSVIFQAPRGGVLSDMSLLAVCRRMNVKCVPHGFRSTFRDWCAEMTNVSRDVAEMALAHTISNEVEAAYRRGDLFEKRRTLMNEWAKFLEQQ